MAVISLFSASHCHGEEVARGVAARLQYRLLEERELLEAAHQRYRVPADALSRAMHGPRSVFNRFTHDKERNVAYLRAALAELIQADGLVHHGFAGHLLPGSLSHVLKVGLVARQEFRIKQAREGESLAERAAEKLVDREDEARKQWTLHLFGLSPWDKSLYDVFLPMDDSTVEGAVELICESAGKPALQYTAEARKAATDYLLASRVSVELARKGLEAEVKADGGRVTLIINKYVMRLEHHMDELKKIAREVPNVNSVDARLGPHYKQPDIYAPLDVEVPPKVLLVDDEEEFVLTLSERLETRNLGSAIAHDGEQALSIMETDAPDVMVLDLKMPGIDGLEVLRRVKRDKPGTEVIILTGHGSEREKRLAFDLGAFAYLNKPVDIDVLADTMKKAYAKVRSDRGEGGGEPQV
jgi:CheY-like chemotaxis protein